jgi:acetoin utilization deacetylase AcuC-like enzyme
MGFCLFNNIAVGARHAQRLGYDRVFIADFDVHHGNGTQNIFYSDPDVFFFSSHQWPHYPGTGSTEQQGNGPGKGATANYPMASGSGDKEYSLVYRDMLPGMIESFGPDIVLVSAGYDIHARDPLAGIRVTTEGVGMIAESIISARDVPVVCSLEGGYSIEALAESVYATIRKLCEIP